MSIQNIDLLNYGTLFSILLLSLLLQYVSVWLGTKSRAALLIGLNILIISAIVYLQSIPIEEYILIRPLMYSLLLMLGVTLPYTNWGKIPSAYRFLAVIGSWLLFAYDIRLWHEFFESLTPVLRGVWIYRFNLLILISVGATVLFVIFLWVQGQTTRTTATK
jgi:hypothetical protein